jgi:acetoacetyl-CoA synthetase
MAEPLWSPNSERIERSRITRFIHSQEAAGVKEHQLHTDLSSGDRLFYFTTLGWMMWNWLVSGLASRATLVLFDGNPFHPAPEALWNLAAEERISVFGTSAKYIDACKKAGLTPASTHDLPSLRTILSTGSPLVPESFDWVYGSVKHDVHLASISGGTDIVSCFVLGCPVLPVYRGEIQCRGLGMQVEVFDGAGNSVIGEPGELVCTAPFPAMPVEFWNDPDRARYRAAYFDHYPGVWRHGDWMKLTDIPRTRNGKISEIAVRDVLDGRPAKNTEALANPEALEQFRNWEEGRTSR